MISGRFRGFSALLGALALTAPVGARASVEDVAPVNAPTQFVNPTHRGWKRRAMKKAARQRSGSGGGKGHPTGSREVQVARMQRAEFKRLRKRYRNLVLEKRQTLGVEAKRKWQAHFRRQLAGVGLTMTERMYDKFRPRVLARRLAGRAREVARMQAATRAEEVAA